MKKNNMLRLASVLLVAVLLSTCALSGVFAYYYTSTDADDSARVAKWGVVVTAAADAFSTSYDIGEDDITVNATEKVVAPGTEGKLATMTVTGTPEVDVKVTKTASVELDGWVIDTNTEYCPIVITVNGAAITQTGTIDEFEAAVEAAILGANDDQNGSAVYYYNVNTDLSAQNLDVDVDWTWAFGTEYENDTKLGNLDVAPTISIDVSIAVEQVGD